RLLVTAAVPHPAAIFPLPHILWKVRHFFALRPRGAAKQVRRNNFAYIDRLVRRWSPKWKVPMWANDAVKAVFSEPSALEAALGYYRALRPRLPLPLRRRISVPTAVFAGEDDTISSKAFERARRRFSGHYEVVRMPGGHFLHREHPELFNTQ